MAPFSVTCFNTIVGCPVCDNIRMHCLECSALVRMCLCLLTDQMADVMLWQKSCPSFTQAELYTKVSCMCGMCLWYSRLGCDFRYN